MEVMKWKPFTAMVLVLAGGALPPVLAADEAVAEAAAAEEATLDGLRAEYDKAYADMDGEGPDRRRPGDPGQVAAGAGDASPARAVERMAPLMTKQADDPAVLKHVAWVVQIDAQ